MNVDRLARLHRLRKATTDEKAVVVAREQGRVIAAREAEAASAAARDRVRAALAEGVQSGGAIGALDLIDRHHMAERGVRAVVRQSRRVVEVERLLEVARDAARAAKTEEERIGVLLVAERERHKEEAGRLEAQVHDELATLRGARGLAGDLPEEPEEEV